jgi:hypothetical protein
MLKYKLVRDNRKTSSTYGLWYARAVVNQTYDLEQRAEYKLAKFCDRYGQTDDLDHHLIITVLTAVATTFGVTSRIGQIAQSRIAFCAASPTQLRRI